MDWLVGGAQGYKGEQDASPLLLSEFEYALDGDSAQTFQVNRQVSAALDSSHAHCMPTVCADLSPAWCVTPHQDAVTLAKHGPFPLVQLRVLSNFGHAEFTCVYRFRVHAVAMAAASESS